MGEPFRSGTREEEVQKFIKNSTGMYKENNNNLAVVRFYESAYCKVNYQVWHKDQKIETGEIDGKKYIDFTVPVGRNYEEMMAKVMAYAPHSEVISPEDFRDEWKGNIRTMYEKYLK